MKTEEENFMNEPLKLKWHSLYGQMLRDRKLTEAWKQVKANKGSGGMDGGPLRILTKSRRKESMKFWKSSRQKHIHRHL